MMNREERQRARGKTPETIRLPVLRPVILVILTLLGAFTVCIYWLEERRVDANVQDQIRKVEALLQECLDQDSRLLQGLTDALLRDPDLQRHGRAGDRLALLEHSKPLLDEMQSRYEVTHFCFHAPDRHGDVIDRVTLGRAVREGRCSSGVELGPTGTLTLRLVQPWRVDDELIGYLELGKEVHSVLPVLKHVANVDLALVLEKSLLNSTAWEEGGKIRGRDGDWDLLPHSVVTDHTFGGRTPPLIAQAVSSLEGHGNRLVELDLDTRRYRGGAIVLFDAAGRRVGKIIVMSDIAGARASPAPAAPDDARSQRRHRGLPGRAVRTVYPRYRMPADRRLYRLEG